MKEKISLIARNLFFQNGTKAVSIDDIASELGISKKTIYNHFESKDEIVEYEIDKHIIDHTCDIDSVKSLAKNAIDELIRIYRMNYEQHHQMKPVFISDIRKFYPQSWVKLENFFGECIPNTIADNIRRGQEEGFYRLGINVEFISYMYFKSIFNQIDFFTLQKKYSIVELDKEHLYYHINAIGTKKGIKYLDKIKIDE